MSVSIAGREVFNNSQINSGDINNPDIDGGTADNTTINNSIIGKSTPAELWGSPSVSKGPAIDTSFTGADIVTASASTTVVFGGANAAANAIKAGYSATNPILGTTLISNGITRYIVSWTNATTCVVDSSVTWAGTAITSVQLPISSEVTSASPGVLKRATLADGTEYFVGNVGIGTTSPSKKLEIYGGVTDGLKITSSANSPRISLKTTTPSTTSGGIVWVKSDDTTGPAIFSHNAVADNNLEFYTNDIKMVIKNDGNVGIGTTAPTSTIHGAGSFALPITTKTADYTAGASDYTILVSCSSANITITLPAASGCSGRIYNIKKIDATGYTVTVDGNSSETIDGALTQVISTQYESLQIQNNGTSWYII